MSVFVLSGELIMHLQETQLTLTRGEGIEIPRGWIHWAENIHRDASEVSIVFVPPFDGEDRRFVE